MIFLITAIAITSLFAFLYSKELKEKRTLSCNCEYYSNKVKDLNIDLTTFKKEKERLEDRNSYLEGRLNIFLNANGILDARNKELEQLYSLAKEDANRAKFNLIELEERMPLLKGKAAKTKKGISENISREKHAHPDMPQKQAVAIAFSQARGGKPRKGAKKK